MGLFLGQESYGTKSEGPGSDTLLWKDNKFGRSHPMKQCRRNPLIMLLDILLFACTLWLQDEGENSFKVVPRGQSR